MIPDRNEICALIVTYFPDPGFPEHVTAILDQVGGIIIVDNASPEAFRKRALEPVAVYAGVRFILNSRNLGLAAALNQGLAEANDAGFEWVVTLDQDTRVFQGCVEALLEALEGCALRPAVIGSNYFNINKGRPFLRIGSVRAQTCLPRKTVITSGSMIHVPTALAIGGFREDYFIDSVDHEFCLRVRRFGHRVVISRRLGMAHGIGGAARNRVPFTRIVIPDHPPVRKYYMARNTLVTVLDYFAQEPAWCLKQMFRLAAELGSVVMLEKNKRAKLKAFAAGLMDGSRRRMGPCLRDWANAGS